MLKEAALLKNHLAKKNLKLTKQREVILRAFLKTDHITAEDLYKRIGRKNSRIGLATIYRTLNLLCEIGIGQQRYFGDNKTIFDNVLNKKHHDHLICELCGKIIEFECPPIERLQEKIADQYGFTLSKHRLELYGQCNDWKNCVEMQKTTKR